MGHSGRTYLSHSRDRPRPITSVAQFKSRFLACDGCKLSPQKDGKQAAKVTGSMMATALDDKEGERSFVCLYCKKTKKASEESREHIIPDSIGGCCTIKGVCAKCNSDFGSEVESLKGFLSWAIIRLTAIRLDITGHSGTPHPIVFDKRATLKDVMSPGQPAVDLAANIMLRRDILRRDVIPIVTKDSFTGTEEQGQKWRERVTQRLKQHGLEASFGRTDYDTSQSPMEFHMEENDELILRTLAKIGLCYVRFAIGHDAALDESFDPLRSHVHSGQTGGGPFAGITRQDLSNGVAHPALHLLSLLQDGPSMFCVINIFNVASALVYLGEGAIPPDAQHRILIMDPVAGSSQTWHVPEALHRQWADNMTLPSPYEVAFAHALDEAKERSTDDQAEAQPIDLPPPTQRSDVVTSLLDMLFDKDERAQFRARVNVNLPAVQQIADADIDEIICNLYDIPFRTT